MPFFVRLADRDVMSEFTIAIKSVRNKKFSCVPLGTIVELLTRAMRKLLYGEVKEPFPAGCKRSAM